MKIITIVKLLQILVTFLALLPSFASNAKELKIAVPSNMPPWTVEKGDKGITLEILGSALAKKGHTFKPVYVSLARQSFAMKDPTIDGIAMVQNKKVKGPIFTP